MVSTGSHALRGSLELPLLGTAGTCCRTLLRRERLTRALQRTCARGRTLLRRDRLARPLQKAAAHRLLQSRRESRGRTGGLLEHRLPMHVAGTLRRGLVMRTVRDGKDAAGGRLRRAGGRTGGLLEHSLPMHVAGTLRRGLVMRTVRDGNDAAGGRLRRAGHGPLVQRPGVCALTKQGPGRGLHARRSGTVKAGTVLHDWRAFARRASRRRTLQS